MGMGNVFFFSHTLSALFLSVRHVVIWIDNSCTTIYLFLYVQDTVYLRLRICFLASAMYLEARYYDVEV